MSTETELPPEVIAAIRASRKIEAIKLLREQRGLGLKEAKQEVDAYALANPHLLTTQAPRMESGLGRLVMVVLAVVVCYATYTFLT